MAQPEVLVVDLDMSGQSLLRATLQSLASAPGSPVARQMYYDSVIDSPRVRNAANSAWITLDATKLSGVIQLSALATNPLDRTNHTGTQVASTISNFDVQVRTSRLDQMAVPTAAVSLNGQLLNNVADPVSAQDAATRSWVLTQVQSAAAGIDPKPSCRYTTTGNITLSGLTTQANIAAPGALTAGDRILVKNQSTASQNLIYVAAAGAWTVAQDSTNGNLTSGALVVVTEGSQASTVWMLGTADPITVGTTALTWNQFGAGSIYTADANGGLQLVGAAFSIKPASGGGISVSSAGAAVDSTVARTGAAATITGDGSTTSFVITHNLGKRGFPVEVSLAASPYNRVRAGIVYTSTNTLTVSFNVAPAVSENYTVAWAG